MINPKFQNLKNGIDSCQSVCLIGIVNEVINVYTIIIYIISRLHCTNVIENLSKNKLYNQFIKLFNKQTQLFEPIFKFDFLKKYLANIKYHKMAPSITKSVKTWEKISYPISLNENILLLKQNFSKEINKVVKFITIVEPNNDQDDLSSTRVNESKSNVTNTNTTTDNRNKENNRKKVNL